MMIKSEMENETARFSTILKNIVLKTPADALFELGMRVLQLFRDPLTFQSAGHDIAHGLQEMGGFLRPRAFFPYGVESDEAGLAAVVPQPAGFETGAEAQATATVGVEAGPPSWRFGSSRAG